MKNEKYLLLTKLIFENANNKEEVKMDSNLVEDLGYDSVALVQLIIDIEDEFGINLTNDDLVADKLETTKLLFELIEKHIGSKGNEW